MNTRQLLERVRDAADEYRIWYKWPGPLNIHTWELHRIRRDLMIACALFRVERKKEYARTS